MKVSAISTWKMSLVGMKVCNGILQNNGSAEKAVIEGVRVVENEPAFHSVGYGGLPDRNGHVFLDAGFMNGRDLSFGSVGALEGVESAIALADLLSRERENNFLVGSGAFRYATEHGLPERNNLTDEAYQIYQKRKEELNELKPYDGHDTVCFIAADRKDICCGVSTSGLFMKHPGRLGDSPVCGSGFYADNETGAVCCTGMGEDIIKGALAKEVIMHMQMGLDVQSSCQQTLDHLMKRLPSVRSVSIIALDTDGNFGVATNCDFPFVVFDEENGIRTFMSRCTNNTTVYYETDFEEILSD